MKASASARAWSRRRFGPVGAVVGGLVGYKLAARTLINRRYRSCWRDTPRPSPLSENIAKTRHHVPANRRFPRTCATFGIARLQRKVSAPDCSR